MLNQCNRMGTVAITKVFIDDRIKQGELKAI